MHTSKAFRYRVYRIYPTPAQIARIEAWESALRWLWNLANEQRRMGYARPRDKRRFPTAFDQINELTGLRAELPWLADVPRNVCGQLLVELDKAWQRYFKKLVRAPRWKRKGRDFLSICEPHPKMWRLDGKNIRFPKLGNLRAVIHRPLEGKPKTCTLKRDGDQWFVSIVCEIDMLDPIQRTEPIVALDRGVMNIVGDSNGRLVQSPRFYEASLCRLASAQRSVSRKKKGSKNREKANVRVMRLHRKVRRQREYFLHGLSHDYAKNHGTVVIEKLQIGNMTRNATGTVEAPGRNVRQKSILNRSILNVGWSRFAEMLRYKLTWNGGTLVEVPAAYSSQTCSACGHVDAKSRKKSIFCCIACGHRDHADLNAAKVLLARANRSGLPVEGSSMDARRSRKRITLRVPRRVSEGSTI
jgi:putative transposase